MSDYKNSGGHVLSSLSLFLISLSQRIFSGRSRRGGLTLNKLSVSFLLQSQAGALHSVVMHSYLFFSLLRCQMPSSGHFRAAQGVVEDKIYAGGHRCILTGSFEALLGFPLQNFNRSLARAEPTSRLSGR